MSEYKEVFKYTDQIVYGVLGWWSNVGRKWESYTAKQLTVMVSRLQSDIHDRDREVERLNRIINIQADKITKTVEDHND